MLPREELAREARLPDPGIRQQQDGAKPAGPGSLPLVLELCELRRSAHERSCPRHLIGL
jgi:hypothetical protein